MQVAGGRWERRLDGHGSVPVLDLRPMTTLPDLFLRPDGTRVTTAAEWAGHAAELRHEVVDVIFGGLPPRPRRIDSQLLNTHRLRRFGDVEHRQFRVCTTAPDCSFVLDLLLPAADAPSPVIVDGDNCWRCLSDDIAQRALGCGYGLATFNRCELAADVASAGRNGGIYDSTPGASFGAIAAWAWGYHRSIDILLGLPEIDGGRIAVTGHSRGGKAALLAGATDERIALTAPNNSGCGGAGCFRIADDTAESLRKIVMQFPHWFGPRLASYGDDPASLPVDLHTLKALVAPRALLTTEALGDLWANPAGTWLTHLAAADVYRFIGQPDQIGIAFREGGHSHGLVDWETLLTFADWRFRGINPGRSFAAGPAAS